MERPQSRYVKAIDGVSIGYQVFGDGPYDLVLCDPARGFDQDVALRLTHAFAALR